MQLNMISNYQRDEAENQSEAYRALFGRPIQQLRVPLYQKTNDFRNFDSLEMNRVWEQVGTFNDQYKDYMDLLHISDEFNVSELSFNPNCNNHQYKPEVDDYFSIGNCHDVEQPCVVLAFEDNNHLEQDITQHNNAEKNGNLEPMKTKPKRTKAAKKIRKESSIKSQGDTFYSEHFAKDDATSSKNIDNERNEHYLEESENTSQKLKLQFNEWNYFSLRRACFRGMSAFYKDKFEGIYKSWSKSKNLNRKHSMKSLVENFICEQFKSPIWSSDIIKSSHFADWVTTVLHSHRHNKSKEYIQDWDFSKIRKVLYSFSTSAKKIFLADKNYALIFANFYETEGENFIKWRSKRKSAQFKIGLQTEFNDLYNIAIKTLSDD